PPAAAVDLRAGRRRPHPGPDPGLAPEAAEQARSGLFEDLDLGVLLVDAELIERDVPGLLDGPGGDLDPLHGAHFRFLRLRAAAGRLPGGVTRPLAFGGGACFEV